MEYCPEVVEGTEMVAEELAPTETLIVVVDTATTVFVEASTSTPQQDPELVKVALTDPEAVVPANAVELTASQGSVVVVNPDGALSAGCVMEQKMLQSAAVAVMEYCPEVVEGTEMLWAFNKDKVLLARNAANA